MGITEAWCVLWGLKETKIFLIVVREKVNYQIPREPLDGGKLLHVYFMD